MPIYVDIYIATIYSTLITSSMYVYRACIVCAHAHLIILNNIVKQLEYNSIMFLNLPVYLYGIRVHNKPLPTCMCVASYLNKAKFAVVRCVHDANAQDAANWELSKDRIHFFEEIRRNPRWDQKKQGANVAGCKLCPLVALKYYN